MPNIFWIADTHFGHEMFIRRKLRPFDTLREMDECMIENWNSIVKPGDTVKHLGDFALKKSPDQINELIKILNGNIHLIQGNHDKYNVYKRCNFASIREYEGITVNDQYIFMCHYPMISWNRSFHGSWHIYGHTHENMEKTQIVRDLLSHLLSFNAGVEINNYTPVSFEQIEEEMKTRTPEVLHDYHIKETTNA